MVNQWNDIYKNEAESYKYYDIFKPHDKMPGLNKIFSEAGVKTILDLGCGAGRNLLFFSKLNYDVHGIDYAPDGIKLLQDKLDENNLNASLLVGDVYKPLPYEDDSFDAIVCVQVLQHNIEKNIKNAIVEIRRVLKPGGFFFLKLAGRVAKGKV